MLMSQTVMMMSLGGWDSDQQGGSGVPLSPTWQPPCIPFWPPPSPASIPSPTSPESPTTSESPALLALLGSSLTPHPLSLLFLLQGPYAKGIFLFFSTVMQKNTNQPTRVAALKSSSSQRSLVGSLVFFILVLSTKYICHTFRLIWYVPRELGPHSSRTTAVVFGAQSCGGGGRSVSEVVSLYVVGIRWPPITPTAQSVHSAPTQYAHTPAHMFSN